MVLECSDLKAAHLDSCRKIEFKNILSMQSGKLSLGRKIDRDEPVLFPTAVRCTTVLLPDNIQE